MVTKYRIGDFIEQCNERNYDEKYTVRDVKGLSVEKKFIKTKAKMKGVSLKPYKLVNPDEFAYVTVTSRNSNKITIAHNDSKDTYIVSSSYIVFKIKDTNRLDSEYLYMYFNRPEFDRFARFNSWGSARETFSWEDLCEVELILPPLEIQKKFVRVYKSLINNQKVYEKGLEDLKLVCDATIEKLRREIPSETIGPYIDKINKKNIDGKITLVRGVNSSGQLMPTKAKMAGINLTNYKIAEVENIVYNPSRINLGSVTLVDERCIVSPMYEVFKVNSNKILPQYIMMWLNRKETQRYTLFNALGSVRDTFDFKLMKELEIPIPEIETQRSIVNIYKVYFKRKKLNEHLQNNIKNICSILIKGSVKEMREYAEV